MPKEVWVKGIQSASSFSTLTSACKIIPNIIGYENFIMQKIETFETVDISDEFIYYLCKEMTKATTDDRQKIREVLIRYCDRIVNSGILKTSDYMDKRSIPIIIHSASHLGENVDPNYYTLCHEEFEFADPKFLAQFFNNENTAETLDEIKFVDDHDLGRAISYSITVRSNDDFYYDYITMQMDTYATTDLLNDTWMRVVVIVETMKNISKDDWEKSKLDSDDIYTWITYMISTFDMHKQYSHLAEPAALKLYSYDLEQSLSVLNSQICEMNTDRQWNIKLASTIAREALEIYGRSVLSMPEVFIRRSEEIIKEYQFGSIANAMSEITVAAESLMAAMEAAGTPRKAPKGRVKYDGENEYAEERDVVDKMNDKEDPEEEDEGTYVGMQGGSGKRTKRIANLDSASRKIYRGYKAYKNAEKKVDNQLTKVGRALKEQFTTNPREEILEGKKFSPIKVIKKILGTAAIFCYSKVAFVLYIITKHFRSKSVMNKERQNMISELKVEIKLLDEKIEDARGDGNRQAKYAMMRTRAELQKAVQQLEYGIKADKRALRTAKEIMTGKRSTAYYGNEPTEDV